jgi:hypothetical protein
MAAGSEIRAGRAYVEMSLQDKFSKQLDATAKKLKSFGESIAKIGATMIAAGTGITTPLVAAAMQFASMGDELNKASQRTGIAVEHLSMLKYAAEQSGASFEDLESGLRKMQKAIFDAENKSQSANAALASIGLTVKNLKGLTPEQQFEKIAEGLSKIRDPGAKAAVAMELFGKGGAGLLPLMEDGAKGINELARQAKQLGLVISKEDAEAATKFGDTVDDLWKQIKGLTFQVGAAIANALQPFAEIARTVMTTIIKWVSEHRSLVLAVLAGGLAFVAAGAALVSLGVVMAGVVIAVEGAIAAFGLIATGIGLLFNPIVLVIGALVGLAGYLLFTTDVGQQVIDYLKTKFNELAKTAGDMFGGIADALAAGDISLAAQILWAGLQLAWAQGTNELWKKWADFKRWFLQIGAEAFYGILESYQNVKANLIEYWSKTVTAFQDIWDIFSTGFASSWDSLTDSVAKGILYVQSLWDDSLDYDAAAKQIDEEAKSREQARDKEQNARFRERTDKLNEEKKQTEADKNSAIEQIRKESTALTDQINNANADEKSGLEKKKSDLEAQLAKLREDASKAKNKKQPDAGPGKPFFNTNKFNLDEILNNRAAVQTPAKAAGLFNSRGIQSLESGPGLDYLKRTARAAEETAKNTRSKLAFKP